MTKILPQVKPGKDPLEASSYRPISNLSILGKLYEQAFFDQTAEFINKSNKIDKDQHGGRPAHSTTSCLVEIWETLKQNTDEKNKTAILAIDMSAAYDLCCHLTIWEKCRILKIGQNALKFLRSFLENRSSYTEIGGKKSKILKNDPFGVVQGGKSSGELFLYYLNDLPFQLSKKLNEEDMANSSGKEYVDDLSILAKAPSLEKLLTQLQNDYTKVSDYLINHQMVINESKTQLMVIHPPQTKGRINSQARKQHHKKPIIN